MCLVKNPENGTLIFKDTIMNNSKQEKVLLQTLGVTIDNRLTFSNLIKFKKASQENQLRQEYQTNLMIL